MNELLKEYKLNGIPETAYYIPDFITEQEECEILKSVYTSPKPKWTCLKNRRLQDWGGIPHKNGMIQEDIPAWLKKYIAKVSNLNIYEEHKANHVLVNEYLPGQGIMPHFDGNLFYPAIATISCGSHTVLEFFHEDNRAKVCELFLEKRSLVIIKNDMYTKYMHSINEMTEDKFKGDYANLKLLKTNYAVDEKVPRDTRISLTIRNVPKVCKLKLQNFIFK